MFPRYLQYLLTDFRQIFVTGASQDRDELIRFWGQKVKGQGHSMTDYIPDFYVSTISLVPVDGFSPNFCHWCISGQRCTDCILGSKGQMSRSQHDQMRPRILCFRDMSSMMDFCQTFVTGASWVTDDRITFLGQKVKVQGHHLGGGVQHSTLPSSATFSSSLLWTLTSFCFSQCMSYCKTFLRASNCHEFWIKSRN